MPSLRRNMSLSTTKMAWNYSKALDLCKGKRRKLMAVVVN